LGAGDRCKRRAALAGRSGSSAGSLIGEISLLREISNTSTIFRMAPELIHRYDDFIDGFARLMQSQRGVPLVGGRIFAYLLVCEPVEQTAAQISGAIGASLGTVSSMTRLLLSARLIERVTRRGERSAVYLIAPDAMSTITRATIEAAQTAREWTDRGLALMADRPPLSRARLQDLRDVYLIFEKSIPALLASWEKGRRETTA
jgi:DNA-binding MarR family transcriptional regulator